jgi:hypothetical protein
MLLTARTVRFLGLLAFGCATAESEGGQTDRENGEKCFLHAMSW